MMKQFEKFSTEDVLNHISQKKIIIDVRAPVEFNQGFIPGSINLPILNDDERKIIGTCYKTNGNEAATALGYRIVSDQNKFDKLVGWKKAISNHPEAIVTCFRGGQRSQITQKFLFEAGLSVARVDGGFKNIRNKYIEIIEQFCSVDLNHKLWLIAGETGSAKTKLLHELTQIPQLDLEGFAHHKGSAFGKTNKPQPAQITFENLIAQNIYNQNQKNTFGFLIEDESRIIGSNHLPVILFDFLRRSSIVKINEMLENRVDHIFSEYVTDEDSIYLHFISCIQKISRKLGGLRSTELISDIEKARLQFQENGQKTLNKIWIEKMLVWYYDPMYQYSLSLRNPKVLFQGNYLEVKQYLMNEYSKK